MYPKLSAYMATVNQLRTTNSSRESCPAIKSPHLSDQTSALLLCITVIIRSNLIEPMKTKVMDIKGMKWIHKSFIFLECSNSESNSDCGSSGLVLKYCSYKHNHHCPMPPNFHLLFLHNFLLKGTKWTIENVTTTTTTTTTLRFSFCLTNFLIYQIKLIISLRGIKIKVRTYWTHK